MSITLTEQESQKINRAHGDLTAALISAGIIEPPASAPAPTPQWLTQTRKQWGLLHDLRENHNGDLGADQWSLLGQRHGYDPRGLGGFFVGGSPLMARQGERRRLTTHGERFIDRWSGDFADEA